MSPLSPSGTSVRKLPETVIRRIAAGEVIERPASVVREAVENALDSGAREIRVRIVEGGKVEIRVEDDGSGIAREDLPRVVERFTTSKIRDVEDLERVATLGFRGEALHAIAVSGQLTLITRTAEDPHGWKAEYEEDRLVRLEPAPRPVGTTLVLRHLFRHLPARRAYLGSVRQETRRVVQVMEAMVLAHPDRSFVLENEKRVLVQAPAVDDLAGRIGQLFGPEFLERLQHRAVEGEGWHGEIWFSPPEDLAGNTAFQWIVVNGRVIRDDRLRGLIYRALEIPSGHHPRFLLRLEVDPSRVNWHIHPQKREVRFHPDLSLHRALFEVLRHRPASPPSPVDLAAPTTYASTPRVQEPPRPTTDRATLFAPALGGSRIPYTSAEGSLPSPVEGQEIHQVFAAYLIFEREGELWMVDQHAAHERVIYERLLRQGDRPRDLLFPLVVHLSPEERALVEELREELERTGFRFRPVSGDALILDAIPAAFQYEMDAEAFRALLHEVAEGGKEHRLDRYRKTVACKAAVKAGDPLRPEARRRLIEDWLACETPQFCPHGRPVVYRISRRDLDRKFHRPG
jgi:DNA mismatch repair enzyme (predicted ATPase)